MPQNIPVTCDGCGKKFFIKYVLSYPKSVIVLARHDDAAKEWGALGARDIIPSAITYEPKINNRKVQGEMTGAGAQLGNGTADSGTVISGNIQGVSLSEEDRTGTSTFRVKCRCNHPLLQEAGDHRDV